MPRLDQSDLSEAGEFLGRNPFLHTYAIGDLDERFKPFVEWHGHRKQGSLDAVICIYKSTDDPTVMALTEESGFEAMRGLLSDLIPDLPSRFQAHLSPGLEELFSETHSTLLDVPHYKMALTEPSRLSEIDTRDAVRLTEEDIPELLELYAESYPGNWFEPEMLPINFYYGIRERGRLTAAAGTHVYSPEFRTAALGNITVRPDCRGRGLGTAITAAIAAALISEGIQTGLNVKIKNEAAISCYRRAGFTVCGNFGEWIFQKK